MFAAAISAIALAIWAVPALADLPLPSPSLPPIPTPKLPLPSPSLPVSLTPVPTPSVPAVPTPSLPVSLTPSPPATPSLPPVGGTPGSTGNATGPGGQGKGTGSSAPSQPTQGVTIPFTGIVVASTLDAALLVALAVLPLLFGIWLLLFGRTWSEARKTRDARIRMALASDLGLSPRELASLSTKGLFKLREQAAFDDLTGVLRRAAGVAAAEREISRARRNKTPLTVAFLDVDGLKATNDQRGHAAGDQLLKGLASGLKSGLRGQDLVVRYGGDEFVCILPDTAAEGAREKLRQIQAELAPSGIVFSVGLVQLERSDDVVSLLGRADSHLYDAKARRGAVRPPIKLQPDEGRKRVPA
jgi:diguanylate cyclase (GGDEF)-like protein